MLPSRCRSTEAKGSLVTIGWLDPAIGTANAGDYIISEAIARELAAIAPNQRIQRFTTHRPWTPAERAEARKCHIFLVGGTNLLSSHPIRYRQWAYGLADTRILKSRCILFGVGWWQYQRRPDPLARIMLRTVLHPGILHAARDSYTVGQLSAAGIRAVNTSCPTLWSVPQRGEVKYGFRSSVVATVTNYHPDFDRDRTMLAVLRNRADRLRVWPQGQGDAEYVRRLGFGDCLVDTGLETFNAVLQEPGTEYVGTRLHAAVRALQTSVPAVIVSVDNRATEIGRDVGLWYLERKRVDGLTGMLDRLSQWELRLPTESISSWRDELAAILANPAR
jgi:hypothetical protein